MPSVNPGPLDLETLITDLRERVRILEASAVLAQGGTIKVAAGEVIQSTNFDGALPGTAGTMGWALGGAGSAMIINNLVLRGGIIGDAALANPAAFGVANADVSGLTFTTVTTERDATIAVPSGYTRALVMATATSGATAAASAIANLYVSCTIQGAGPTFVAQQLPAGLAGSVTRSFAASLSGLAGGGTVTIGALGVIDTNGTVVAGSCNLHVSAVAVFLR